MICCSNVLLAPIDHVLSAFVLKCCQLHPQAKLKTLETQATAHNRTASARLLQGSHTSILLPATRIYCGLLQLDRDWQRATISPCAHSKSLLLCTAILLKDTCRPRRETRQPRGQSICHKKKSYSPRMLLNTNT
jgi:hypothetical protein